MGIRSEQTSKDLHFAGNLNILILSLAERASLDFEWKSE